LEQGSFAESYRILRTQIMHRFREEGWNVIGITSPKEGEGKTLTSVNLAISVAMGEAHTVLLVDADLRNGGVGAVLGLEDRGGLTDLLLDEQPMEQLLVHPSIGRLVVLPAGGATARSAELLGSPKMVELVEEFKRRYASRFVVFDLPPLLTRADTLAFAPCVDALLLVVEEGRTTAPDIDHALALVKGPAPVIGTVLNKSGRARSRHRAVVSAGT
jgi:capsular exopolysaccharide synthesis family protein